MSGIPKTMRAVVYRGVNDLRLETVPVPRIGPGELLVRVAVCGVCPTDIKKIHHGTVPPPRIFGHETAGTIVKIGGGNASLVTRHSSLKVGDRVALHHHVPCLDCHFCRHRAFAQCETYKRTGITAGFEPAGGGYAGYVRVMNFVLPGVVKIPAKNSFAEGAMLEPVNTVLKAVRRLNLLPGDTVLVAGQGPIGLMFTRLLKIAGIKVLATDLLPSRLKLAKKFGARRTCLASEVSSLVTRHSSPLDAAIIAVPSDTAVQQALQLVRGGGQVLLFAHTRRSGSEIRNPKSEIRNPAPLASRPSTLNSQLDLASICVDEKDLIGSYSADFTLQREVARLVFSRRLDVRDLITHSFTLDKTAAAIQLASGPTPDSLKILVNVGDNKIPRPEQRALPVCAVLTMDCQPARECKKDQ
ncbi:MAG: alcohol dehydrogenase catalytic domain-containing protein [Verrucomicrobiales bacterium]|nr:alcohol dehydrogenase catalytic domain-containing protein [Verrucomicrobiales bacterium]